MIFFMLLKFSSRLKAAQYYGIVLTIRSIVISAISAHLAEWRSIGVDVSDQYYDVQTFCKFSIAVGILGAFIGGILIFGTFKRSRVAIFVWMILAPIDVLGLFANMIIWSMAHVWFMFVLCFLSMLKTIRAIFVAHQAREEITNEKTNESSSNLGREDTDVNNVA
jgi:hypothetical protein